MILSSNFSCFNSVSCLQELEPEQQQASRHYQPRSGAARQFQQSDVTCVSLLRESCRASSLRRTLSLSCVYRRTLRVASNWLTGELPTLSACVSLTTLDFSRNRISGTMPDSYTTLPSLQCVLFVLTLCCLCRDHHCDMQIVQSSAELHWRLPAQRCV